MARQRSVLTERMWRERLGRFRQRDLTVADFCEDEGVSTASFYVWRRRLRGGEVGSRDTGHLPRPSQQALFVPVAVRPVVTELRIDVADGVVIRLPLDADERLLRACLRAAVDATSRGEDR